MTLLAWYARKRSLSVEPMFERDADVLFWIAVVFPNSLGTASGNAFNDAVGLSNVQGALVCSGVIVIQLVPRYLARINAALLFWAAFILTRPFGATFGDFLTKGHDTGGLQLGTLATSLVALAALVLVVFASDRLDRARPAVPDRA